jgi:hypothetical protein
VGRTPQVKDGRVDRLAEIRGEPHELAVPAVQGLRIGGDHAFARENDRGSRDRALDEKCEIPSENALRARAPDDRRFAETHDRLHGHPCLQQRATRRAPHDKRESLYAAESDGRRMFEELIAFQ